MKIGEKTDDRESGEVRKPLRFQRKHPKSSKKKEKLSESLTKTEKLAKQEQGGSLSEEDRSCD